MGDRGLGTGQVGHPLQTKPRHVSGGVFFVGDAKPRPTLNNHIINIMVHTEIRAKYVTHIL